MKKNRLTDYYKFRHLPECQSATRMDCIASSTSYPNFEALRDRAGRLFVHVSTVPGTFKGNGAAFSITKGTNISSVFVPDVSLNFGRGDVKGTKDALLIIFDAGYTTLEIFVAREQKKNRLQLWEM